MNEPITIGMILQALVAAAVVTPIAFIVVSWLEEVSERRRDLRAK